MPSWLDYDDEGESQGESGGPTEGGRAFTGSAAAPSRLGDGDRKAARSGSDDLDKKPSWLENELPSWLEDDHRGRPTDERCIYKKSGAGTDTSREPVITINDDSDDDSVNDDGTLSSDEQYREEYYDSDSEKEEVQETDDEEDEGEKKCDKEFDISPAHVAAMELVDLLNTRGVPLSCYEDIRKWCTKHFTLGVLDENNIATGEDGPPKLPSHRETMAFLVKRYNLEDYMPVKMAVYLPGCGKRKVVVCHGVEVAIESMVKDPHLMRPENLLIDLDAPFSIPKEPESDGYYEDVNSGSVYRFASKYLLESSQNFIGKTGRFKAPQLPGGGS